MVILPKMVVTQLNIYPVKSCRGISVQHAKVVERGFEFDRRFMIVDGVDKFMTQRKHPHLALIETNIKNSELHLSGPAMADLALPLQPVAGQETHVRVWDDTVVALLFSAEADHWLSAFLGIPCHLVYMPDSSVRPVSIEYRTANEHYSLADAFPFLLTTEESLAELNRRLESPVAMNQFRPNIVISGFPPFAEDTWRTIQFGAIRMRVAKPCVRCSTTTVDQTTGVRGEEPLRTLATFRNRGGDVLFGQNLIHESQGFLAVGDSVDVLE